MRDFFIMSSFEDAHTLKARHPEHAEKMASAKQLLTWDASAPEQLTADRLEGIIFLDERAKVYTSRRMSQAIAHHTNIGTQIIWLR